MKKYLLMFLLMLILMVCADQGQAAIIQYYVRLAGHDTNCNGLVDVDDSVGVRPNCAKLTIYGGITQVVTDLNGVTANSATINVQPGTYAETHNLILSKGDHYPEIGDGTLNLHDGTSGKEWTIQGNGGVATIDATGIATYQTYGSVVVSGLDYTRLRYLKVINSNDATKNDFYLSAAEYGLIEYCQAYYYNHGIELSGSENSVVRYNYIEGSHDAGSSSGIKIGNTITDNTQVYYNVINLAGGTGGNYHGGINISGADGAKVWNNTIYGSHKVGILVWTGATGVQLRNNLVFGSDTYELVVTTDSQGTFDSDYNLFYRASGKPIYWGGTFAAATGPADGTEYTVAEFAAAVSVDTHSVATDPKTVSTSDFNLLAGSPAINKGTILAGLVLDYAGNTVPKCGATDIGAYEYQTCGGSGSFGFNFNFSF